MTRLTREEMLILLIEECGEVIQAATKCLRFGYDSEHVPEYGRNDVALAREMGDLAGVMDALPASYLGAFGLARATKMNRAEAAKAKYAQPDLAEQQRMEQIAQERGR